MQQGNDSRDLLLPGLLVLCLVEQRRATTKVSILLSLQPLFSIESDLMSPDQSHCSIINHRFHYFIYYSLNLLERGTTSTPPSQVSSPRHWRRHPSVDWYYISSLSNIHLVEIVIRFFPLSFSCWDYLLPVGGTPREYPGGRDLWGVCLIGSS